MLTRRFDLLTLSLTLAGPGERRGRLRCRLMLLLRGVGQRLTERLRMVGVVRVGLRRVRSGGSVVLRQMLVRSGRSGRRVVGLGLLLLLSVRRVGYWKQRGSAREQNETSTRNPPDLLLDPSSNSP